MTTFAITVPEPWSTLTRLAIEHAGLPMLIDAEEAAHLLGISVPALRKRVQRSQLPRGAVVQTGRSYMLRRDRLF